MNDRDFDRAFRQMIETALWSSTASTPDGTVTVPCDDYFDNDDIDPAIVQKLRGDLADFIASNIVDLDGMEPEQVGHDFWLTRNGHGTGFWDRGLGERGDRLSDACRPYGEVDLDLYLPEDYTEEP